MAVTKADASSLSEKLIVFRGLLRKGEQEALDGMLNTYLARVEDVPNSPPARVARGERLVAFPAGVDGQAAAQQLIRDTKAQRLTLGGAMGIHSNDHHGHHHHHARKPPDHHLQRHRRG